MQQEIRLQEEGGEPREEVEPDMARLANEQVQAMYTSHPDFCSKMNLAS